MQIARVSYAYNSILEDKGQPAYMLDAFVNQDGKTMVDTHQTFKTRAEFRAAIDAIVPVIRWDDEEVIPVLSSGTAEEADGVDEVYAMEVGGA